MNAVPRDVDLVVVGSGVSGLAAAVTAAEAGVTVVVFEKQRSPGGTSNFFEGMFAVESEMQRQRYITYSRDEAFRSIMDYSHWRANPRLVRAFVDESGPTISWLQQKGVEFGDATINMPDSPRCYHVVKGTGAAVVKALVTTAHGMGVDIRLGAPVKRILKHGGRVTGVAVEENEKEIEVAAGAVVVASGGYANNKEWIRKYAGFDLEGNLIPIGNVDKMGDGIRMSWEVGAAEDSMGLLELFRVGPLGPDLPMKGQIEFAAGQPDLWVNPRGERFCDEGIGFYDTHIGNANARHKEGYTWSLFDDSIVERLLTEGIDRGIGVENPPGSQPGNIMRELKAALARGSQDIFAADSVEALAPKLDMDPALLKATVDEYNGFCAKGHDDLFAKNPRYLRPLKGPGFYAAKMRTIFLGTHGGIRINEKAEVVDRKGDILPGLYAAGFDAAGIWGDSYSIRVSSGASAGFAVNSGRIAGRTAAGYLRTGH
jgi:fumarate reductase flavoprotein subunit